MGGWVCCMGLLYGFVVWVWPVGREAHFEFQNLGFGLRSWFRAQRIPRSEIGGRFCDWKLVMITNRGPFKGCLISRPLGSLSRRSHGTPSLLYAGISPRGPDLRCSLSRRSHGTLPPPRYLPWGTRPAVFSTSLRTQRSSAGGGRHVGDS